MALKLKSASKAKAQDQKETKATKAKTTTVKNQELPATKVKKAKDKLVKETTPVATASLVEQVITNREVLYIYPADCTDTLAKKKFRQKVRNTLNKLQLQLMKLEQGSKEYKAKEKELKAYTAQYKKVV